MTATHSTARNHLLSNSLHYIDRQVIRSAIYLEDSLFFFHLPKELEPTPLLRQQVGYLRWNEASKETTEVLFICQTLRGSYKKCGRERYKCWWMIICLEGVSQQMSLPSFQAEANNPSKHNRTNKQNKEATVVFASFAHVRQQLSGVSGFSFHSVILWIDR